MKTYNSVTVTGEDLRINFSPGQLSLQYATHRPFSWHINLVALQQVTYLGRTLNHQFIPSVYGMADTKELEAVANQTGVGNKLISIAGISIPAYQSAVLYQFPLLKNLLQDGLSLVLQAVALSYICTYIVLQSVQLLKLFFLHSQI